MAYEQVAGPLGAERGDLLFAKLEYLIHSLWVERKHQKKFADFLIQWDDAPQPQTPEEWLAMVRLINAMAGGKEE